MTPLIRIRNISKGFPGVQALDDVSFDVEAGKIHVLMGENGAGKSTLMKILAGAYQPDTGSLEIDGQPAQMSSPIRARELGVGMIYQELTVLDNLDVGRNIMLGQEPVQEPFGRMDWNKLYQQAGDILSSLDLQIDPRAPLPSLSIGEQQMVEIARVTLHDPRIMIMDEPTSSLGKHEEEVLFDLVRRLRDRGVGIIYISHRMEEVFMLADTITVLRDGHHIATQPAADLDRAELVRLMVGRDVDEARQQDTKTDRGDVVLAVENLSDEVQLQNISFMLHRGEILGLAGLVGSGRTRLARHLFGSGEPFTGSVQLDGRSLKLTHPNDAIQSGIAYVPEDRKGLGLVLMMDVGNNLSLASLDKNAVAGVLNRAGMMSMVRSWVDRLSIRIASVKQTVEKLSGGNQQKVVLAKWLTREPRVLILNEPTRGVDVGAKAEVHALIREIAEQGVSVLMISSELPELLAMSDRIMVMHEGRISGELSSTEATEEKVVALAFGEGEPV
ncbi:MAG: sugar ABC transporter ATP-binding protein [Chloroflexota bacterium]